MPIETSCWTRFLRRRGWNTARGGVKIALGPNDTGSEYLAGEAAWHKSLFVGGVCEAEVAGSQRGNVRKRPSRSETAPTYFSSTRRRILLGHDLFELLADFGLDLAFEHHGRERNIA